MISQLHRQHWLFREKWGFTEIVLVFTKRDPMVVSFGSLLSFLLFSQLRSDQLRPWIWDLSGFTTTTLSPGLTRTSPTTTTITIPITTATATTTTTVGIRPLRRSMSWKEQTMVKHPFLFLLPTFQNTSLVIFYF